MNPMSANETNEEIIRDGENLETISRNIDSSQRNVEITNESLENIVILQDNRKKKYVFARII